MEPRLRGHVTALLEAPSPQACLDYAEGVLRRCRFDVDRPEGAAAVVATRGGGGVVLSGHVDVVPAGDGWSVPPHRATIKDGRLFGRGSADMRGAVAAMLRAVERTRTPCRVVLTADEETTMDAARALAATGVVDGVPLVVVGEPTSLRLGVAGKGLAWIRLRTRGRSAHGAAPERGVSAAALLVEALAKVPFGPFGAHHPLLGRATLTLTGLASGGPFNVVPDAAEARIDARFPPPLGPEDAVAMVRAAVPQAEVTLERGETAFDAGEATVERIRKALRGQAVLEPAGVPFGSEANRWGPRAPTVILGPGRIEDAHAPDESVAVAEVERAVVLYAMLLERVQGGGP